MEFVIIAGVVVYFIRTAFFLIGVIKQRIKKRNICGNISEKDKNYDLPFVSVVIPARNEEQNIRNAVLSVNRSSYPKEKFEIIVVNDRSEDKTAEILEELTKTIENLKIVNVVEKQDNENLKGKARALQYGIENAKGQLILMTDADCEVNKNWIKKIVECFRNERIGIIPAFTLIKVRNIFDKIQAVEWVYMHTMAMGGIGMNKPLGCYGNNLSIRKDVFVHLGGYRKIKFSVTEDLALLKAVFDAKYDILYLLDGEATVETLPCKTFKEYILQHQRWAIGGLSLGWKAVAFVFTTIMFWTSMMLSIANLNFELLFIVIFSRYLLDFILIFQSLKKLSKLEMTSWILFSVPFFVLMELVAPFLVINKTVHWKGQKF